MCWFLGFGGAHPPYRLSIRLLPARETLNPEPKTLTSKP